MKRYEYLTDAQDPAEVQPNRVVPPKGEGWRLVAAVPVTGAMRDTWVRHYWEREVED